MATINQKQAFNILKKYKNSLNKQQLNTFKGQILKNDINGFIKGLKKVLERKKEIKMEQKMTKTKAVLLHLEEKGNITSWEAIKEYGATRLSGIIFNLRHTYKMNIINEWYEFKDRYGNQCRYVKYILVKEN